MSKKKEKVALREEILRTTVERYIGVEEQTIASADTLMATCASPLVRQMMKLIRMDSEKHREILGTIKSILEGTVVVTPEEMAQVDKLVKDHLAIENESIILARVALDNTRHFAIRHLLQHLLEDERRHVAMTEQISDYKGKLYS